jgi:hypothetical protein
VSNLVSLRVGDRELLLSNWAKLTGVNRGTLYSRIKAGWTPEQVIGEEARPRVKAKPRSLKGKPKPRKNRLMEVAQVELITKTVTTVVTDDKEIGKAAKAIRILAGLSLSQAAISLGWTLMHVWEMERGRTKWKQKHIDHFNNVARGWVNNGSDDNNAASSE